MRDSWPVWVSGVVWKSEFWSLELDPRQTQYTIEEGGDGRWYMGTVKRPTSCEGSLSISDAS